jgi:hypothetical protein
MSDRFTAYYDDLAVAPEFEFDRALRHRLDQLMAGQRSAHPDAPGEEAQEMTITTVPPEAEHDSKRSRSRWLLIAAAVGAVIAGAAVAFTISADDDKVQIQNPDTTLPASTTFPSVPTSIGIPSTTPTDDPTSSAEDTVAPAGPALTDEQIAHSILLTLGEYRSDGAYKSFVDSTIAMDSSIASTLPECARYELAFHSPDRPARVATRVFQRVDEVSPQYVLVLANDTSANSVYAILSDPQFWAGCGVAYATTEPDRQLPRSIDGTSEAIDPPALDRYGDESTTLALSSELGPVYFSVVRIGRVVVTLETIGFGDSDGASNFTPAEIEQALDNVVSKAEGALAHDRFASIVDDAFLARSVVLDNADYGIRDFAASASGPVRMDGVVAAGLTPCQQFIDTVFESERRPAAVAYKTFYSASIPALVPNYVVVHPSVEQATAMLDGMQDPAFQNECVPAYNTTLPLQAPDAEYWFPFFVGGELLAPEIQVAADDILVRRYTGTWTDDEGVVHGPEEFAYAAVRVGRIVASIEVELTDTNGEQVTSLQQFENVVQLLAVRAAIAQQPVS